MTEFNLPPRLLSIMTVDVEIIDEVHACICQPLHHLINYSYRVIFINWCLQIYNDLFTVYTQRNKLCLFTFRRSTFTSTLTSFKINRGIIMTIMFCTLSLPQNNYNATLWSPTKITSLCSSTKVDKSHISRTLNRLQYLAWL